jgi:hypothetical protein
MDVDRFIHRMPKGVQQAASRHFAMIKVRPLTAVTWNAVDYDELEQGVRDQCERLDQAFALPMRLNDAIVRRAE